MNRNSVGAFSGGCYATQKNVTRPATNQNFKKVPGQKKIYMQIKLSE
jgi:hypothetical protein